MLKRIVAVLLLLTMAFSIVSCNDEPTELDISPLEELMETTYEESAYTPSSYDGYAEALTAAQEFLDADEKTEETYNTVYQDLKTAILLLKKKADKTALIAKIAEAEEYEENIDIYYDASTTALLTYLETARGVADDIEATQYLVDASVQNLTEGIGKLKVRADKSELIALVDDANKVEKDKYLNTDWRDFDSSLSAANQIVEKESATETEITNAHTALSNVMGELVLKPNLTELQAQYERATEVDTTLYSKATVATLDYEMSRAWNALYIVTPTQAEVDAIATALRQAIDGLQIKVTKTYMVTCTANQYYNNNVGNKWGYYTTINDYDFSKKYTFEEEVGITIKAEAVVYEDDEVTDWGWTYFDLVMTDGYTITVEVVVEENRGTYAGNKSRWRMTYTVTEVDG